LYSSAPSTLSTISLLDSISSVLTSSLTDKLVTCAQDPCQGRGTVTVGEWHQCQCWHGVVPKFIYKCPDEVIRSGSGTMRRVAWYCRRRVED
jgi:hypothetical protein